MAEYAQRISQVAGIIDDLSYKLLGNLMSNIEMASEMDRVEAILAPVYGKAESKALRHLLLASAYEGPKRLATRLSGAAQTYQQWLQPETLLRAKMDLHLGEDHTHGPSEFNTGYKEAELAHEMARAAEYATWLAHNLGQLEDSARGEFVEVVREKHGDHAADALAGLTKHYHATDAATARGTHHAYWDTLPIEIKATLGSMRLYHLFRVHAALSEAEGDGVQRGFQGNDKGFLALPKLQVSYKSKSIFVNSEEDVATVQRGLEPYRFKPNYQFGQQGVTHGRQSGYIIPAGDKQMLLIKVVLIKEDGTRQIVDTFHILVNEQDMVKVMRMVMQLRLGEAKLLIDALAEAQWNEPLPGLPEIQIRSNRHQEFDDMLEPYPWIDARLLTGPELALGFASTIQPGEALYSVKQLGGWSERRIVRMTQQQATELQRKRVAMAMESSLARRLIEEFDRALWQRILGQCSQIRNVGRAMTTRDVSLASFVQQVEERWGKEIADWFNLHFRYASVFNTQPKLVQLADALYDHHLQPYVQTILSAEFANWLKNTSARAKVNAVL